MQKTCRQCAQQFEVTDEDLKFYDEVSPVFNGKKFSIPVPELCPGCRLQRRMAFRNERKLYHRKCDYSGKEIISMFSADKPLKVYDQEIWWSDKWDPLEYGRDFDFSKTFSEQFKALYRDVPHTSLYTNNVENSYYTNFVLNQKNCYLIFGGANNEDCLYGKFISFSNSSVDGYSIYYCELCYEGVTSSNCYNCRYFVYCRNCSDSIMIEDCLSCRDCIGCFGLRSKQYYIFNEYVGKERFEQFKKEYEYLTQEKIAFLRQKLDALKKKLPHIGSHIYASEDCSGDMIINSKNCRESFTVKDSEDCKFLNFTPKTNNSYDCTFNSPDGVEFCYNVCSTVGTRFSIVTFLMWTSCSNILYSMECAYSDNLFGCVGLKRKSYCIFNKQYSKEEYGKMVAKIIAHMQKTPIAGQVSEWGEYFPYSLSPFEYNETIANEYFPLTEKQAAAFDMGWKKDDRQVFFQGAAFAIPSGIKDVKDDILKQILQCGTCNKNYKIISQELKFYRQVKLPIPKNCPDCRHNNRLSLENPRKLWDRKCDRCSAEIKTTYAPDRPEKVYCEACYLKEVY